MPTLETASTVVSPPGRPQAPDAPSLALFRDLVEPFGASVDEDLLAAGPRISHRDLVDALVDDRVRASTPELIVLANALPDVDPYTAVGPHLNLLLGGIATSFGISQQGLAAPFTALRIVERFQRAGRCAQAVIAVLEQTTLPTRYPLVHDNGLADSGVLLVLGDGDGPSLSGVEAVEPRQHPGQRLRELAEVDPQSTLLVLGPQVDLPDIADDLPTHRVDSSTYATSVWLAVAKYWQDWTNKYRTVVLCDTEPTSGRSHIAVLRQTATS
jgi:hypothetical protein